MEAPASVMSSQGWEGQNEAVTSNVWEAVAWPVSMARRAQYVLSVFEAVDSRAGRKAPGKNAPRAAASKAQRGTHRSAKRGLSCHHDSPRSHDGEVHAIRHPSADSLLSTSKGDGAASAPALPTNLGIKRATPAGHTVSAFAERPVFAVSPIAR